MVQILCAIILAYLIGSIPTSYLIGKAKGIDIRREGSGNVGATNVLRAVGKLPALLALIADILKGVIPVTLIASFFYAGKTPMDFNAFRAILGLSAVLGHNWSIFLKLKGGRGVATSCGVLGVLLPVPLSAGVAVFFITLLLTKYVSLSSIFMSITVPIVAVLLGSDIELVILAVTLCILISYRHKPNIRRILMGAENKIGGKS